MEDQRQRDEHRYHTAAGRQAEHDAAAVVQQRAVIRAAMHRLLDLGWAEAGAGMNAGAPAHGAAGVPTSEAPSAHPVRSLITSVDGMNIHHLEAGAGRPVVLLHGGSGGGANWFRVLPHVATHCRVLAPDLPGFGLSDAGHAHAPLGRTAADLLARWLDAVEVENAVVAGTSFGGLAALRLAQQAPDRVSGLFLLSSAGLGRELPLLVRLATLPVLAAPGVRPSRRGTATLFRTLLTSNRAGMTQEQVDALVEYLYLSAHRAGTRYLAETLRLFGTFRGQREVLSPAELAALPQPVTIAWGALDAFLPVGHAHAAAGHMAAAELAVIPDAGHSPNWERPGAVVAALRALLDRVERSGPCERAG